MPFPRLLRHAATPQVSIRQTGRIFPYFSRKENLAPAGRKQVLWLRPLLKKGRTPFRGTAFVFFRRDAVNVRRG